MITIIGIDCATQPQKTGLALGTWDGTAVSLHTITLGQKNQPLAQTIASWLPANQPTLLAIDAPLGWPADLGDQLASHQAGEPLPVPPNTLFRRETDQHIWQRTGKLPLDVGADRIARTAHAALTLLADLHQLTGQPIPLAWQPQNLHPLSAIEVYPAGTLKMLFDPRRVPRYKGKDGENGRIAILNLLKNNVTLPQRTGLLQNNDDALDAALCVLAGADFLRGLATPPENQARAQKEGWIWVRTQREQTNE
jgi:predicted RNase H-like nuclease